MQKVAHAYLQTQVTTTSQGALLLMLYDGAVNFLNQAKVKIAERDYAQKGILISKAIDIISELDACLNVDRGGDISDNLHSLYFFCNTRLLAANLRMNVGYIEEVIKILEGLRSAYAHILTPGDVAEAKNKLGGQAGTSNIVNSATFVQGGAAHSNDTQVVNNYNSEPIAAQQFTGSRGQANAGYSRAASQMSNIQSNVLGNSLGNSLEQTTANTFANTPALGLAEAQAVATPQPVAGAQQSYVAPPAQAPVVAPSVAPASTVVTASSVAPASSVSTIASEAKPALENTTPLEPIPAKQGFARGNAASLYRRLSNQD